MMPIRYLLLMLLLGLSCPVHAALPAHQRVLVHAGATDATGYSKPLVSSKQHKRLFRRKYDGEEHQGALAICAFVCSVGALPTGAGAGLIAAFVFGASFTPVFVFVTALYAGLGIVLGILSLTWRKTKKKNRGLAVAAIILGIVGLILVLGI